MLVILDDHLAAVNGRPPASARARAAGQPERADPRRVGSRARLYVVPDVPDRAVVARIDRRLRVVLPAHRRLRRLSFDEDRFLQRQLSLRIGCKPPGKPLPWKVARAAEGVPDADA